MENVREIIKNVARIWRMHKKREALFKAAMLQADQRMRRICTTGYMNALLFQKDIETVYNSYKYYLEDGQLGSIVRSEHDIVFNHKHLPLATILKEHQQQTICCYQELLPQLEANLDEMELVKSHIDKLSEMNVLLDLQLGQTAGA
jgi:hypothetical protein